MYKELALELTALAFLFQCIRFIWKIEIERYKMRKKKPSTTANRGRKKSNYIIVILDINRLHGFLYLYILYSPALSKSSAGFCLPYLFSLFLRSYLITS